MSAECSRAYAVMSTELPNSGEVLWYMPVPLLNGKDELYGIRSLKTGALATYPDSPKILQYSDIDKLLDDWNSLEGNSVYDCADSWALQEFIELNKLEFFLTS